MARVGVCSWSLSPANPAELAERCREIGVSAVQLALDPIREGRWSLDDTVETLSEAGIVIASGMMALAGEDYSTLESIRETGGVRVDESWETHLTAAAGNARIARALGIHLVTFHAGFIPHETDDPLRATMLDRLRAVVDRFGAEGVRIGFETGQETADTLVAALDDLDRDVGVNFDPANMILYGMGDPVAALRTLADRVAQIHIKDATGTATPGTWGAEVPVGDGEVAWESFFDAMGGAGIECDLMIEREAGDDRVRDMRQALELVHRIRGGVGS